VAYLTLPEVKDRLRESSEAHDLRLPAYIGAAERMVIERCGPVTPVDVVEDHRDVDCVVLLRVLPLLSVTTVTVYPGATAVAAEDLAAGTPGYVLDLDAGTLEHSSFAAGRTVRVAYRAGRATVPEDLRNATLDLVAHLWRMSAQRVGPGQHGVFTGRSPEESRPYPAGFAMPRHVEEMLGPETLPPRIG
jgi:hypothetical protein